MSVWLWRVAARSGESRSAVVMETLAPRSMSRSALASLAEDAVDLCVGGVGVGAGGHIPAHGQDAGKAIHPTSSPSSRCFYSSF